MAGLPMEPESLTSLRGRVRDSLVRVYSPGNYDPKTERPGLHRRHVFDTEDGVRMIVSIEEIDKKRFLAVTASATRECAERISKSIEWTKADEWPREIAVLRGFRNRVQDLVDEIGLKVVHDREMLVARSGVIHMKYDDWQPRMDQRKGNVKNLLSYEPESMESAVARFPLALERTWMESEAKDDALPLPRENTFDFESGLRIIVTVDGDDQSATLHVSAQMAGEEQVDEYLREKGLRWTAGDVASGMAVLSAIRKDMEAFLRRANVDGNPDEMKVTDSGVTHMWFDGWPSD